MNPAVVRFDEKVQLTMGLFSATIIAFVARFLMDRDNEIAGFGTVGIAYAGAAFIAFWALRSLGVRYTVTDTSITRESPFGTCKMLWQHIDSIEFGPCCFWLVFHGDGKRLWMKSPRTTLQSWSRNSDDDDDDEDECLTVLMDMAERHGISLTSSVLTPFKTSRS